MADFFQGTSRFPAGSEIVASGDYKSVDPTAIFIDPKGAVALSVITSPSANSGGGGVTVTMYAVDPSTGAKRSLLASTLITGTSPVVITLDPRITTAANANAQVSLPSRVRVEFVGSGTRTTLTYSASAVLSN